MDEYIKREDALDAVLFALVGTGLQSTAIYAIREVPTAAVVPKSEVEELKKAYLHYEETTGLKQAKTDVAREIFEEIEAIKCVGLLPSSWVKQFAELKKKYTEEQNST